MARYYDDPNRCDLTPPRPDKPVLAEGTGNAGKDGFTTLARRARSDVPGTIVPAEEAERREKSDAEFQEMMDRYPYYPD